MERFKLIFDVERVCEWASKRIPNFAGWGTKPQAIGNEREDRLTAAVVYTNFSGKNVWASIVCDEPITRQFLVAIFHNPFNYWGCNHISCAIEASNQKSLSLCSNMGFQQEGLIREAATNGEDIIIMGLLKRECRFLK